MGKPANQTPAKTQPEPAAKNPAAGDAAKPLLWDCRSSLYDSFELKAFERQFSSALHSRSLSMPHLSDRPVTSQPKRQSTPQPSSKKSSKLSRLIHKFLQSVFKPKQKNPIDDTTNNGSAKFFQGKQQPNDGFYVVYEKSGVLSTIPEVPAFDVFSAETKSFVRRTASDRFTFTPIVGIS